MERLVQIMLKLDAENHDTDFLLCPDLSEGNAVVFFASLFELIPSPTFLVQTQSFHTRILSIDIRFGPFASTLKFSNTRDSNKTELMQRCPSECRTGGMRK